MNKLIPNTRVKKVTVEYSPMTTVTLHLNHKGKEVKLEITPHQYGKNVGLYIRSPQVDFNGGFEITSDHREHVNFKFLRLGENLEDE
jgi:hypothetical protein